MIFQENVLRSRLESGLIGQKPAGSRLHGHIDQRVSFYTGSKKAANLKKHGLDFEDAPKIIESDASVTFEDRRFDYGDQRFITLGLLNGEVVVVVTTETDEEIRVISMRKAEQNEQEIYFRNLG